MRAPGPVWALLAGWALVLPAPVPADDTPACLECHAGSEAASQIPDSVHAGRTCLDCHASLAGVEMPHAVPVAPVACERCHAAQGRLYAGSLHGKAAARGDELAPRCASCHGRHDIRGPRDPRSAVSPMRIPYTCGSCHREGSKVTRQREIHQANILENYSESMHGDGLLRKGLAVAAQCASCHTAHEILPHTDPKSSINRANVARTCMQCHSMIETVHRRIINGKLWEAEPNRVPVCVDCHQPHKARRVFYEQGVANADCLTCHAREGVATAGGRSLRVAHGALAGSVHQKVGCAQCHAGVTPGHARPCDTERKRVDCSVCHTTAAEDWKVSIHGKLVQGGSPNAPGCTECHGTHGIRGRKDDRSPIFPPNVPTLCAGCHREGQRAALRYRGTEHSIPEHYSESIHGKGLLKSGLLVTATCSNCHTAHRILPAADPASSVNRRNVATTCAQCHHGVFEKFAASVHSPLVTRTDRELPGCNDCHTAHTIKRTDLAGFRLEIMGRCGRCHAETARSYFETYHGKVSRLGYSKTAKCHDCHGSHDILPVADTRSHLNRLNVVETCRKCHPGATRRFAGYFTHATHHDPRKYPLLFWSFWGMTALLVGTFTVGGLHTLLWIPRAVQIRRARRALEEEAGADPRHVRRFTPRQSVMHVALIMSFITLALTGMTLKFSYTPWAVALSAFMGGFESAGWIHRVAALLMFAIFGTHLRDLLAVRREAGGWRALLSGPATMMLTVRDAREFLGTVRWFLGRGPRPAYGRWTYWEKFDYFAVFWGVAIIGSTGLMLWFPETFTRLLPGWLINVATIIHSDEALLAVGFIFTVHFFNTHFSPDKFPMDLVVFTGRVPLGEFRHDRPAEYEAVAAAGGLAERLTEPPPPLLVRAARIFGSIALAIGLLLVVAIAWAMLFAYR